MTSIVRPASRPPLLLPSPESDYITAAKIQTEPSPEQFMPAGFEEIVAIAALDYTTQLNTQNRSRSGQAVLKLNPVDQAIAVGVILDAIRLAQLAERQTLLPAKPRELRQIIKTGLKLRETERLAAKQLVDELKQVSEIGAKKPVFYDLGLDGASVITAKRDAFNYPITPQPVNARKLMAMVPARRQAVREMAVIAAVTYMAERQEDELDSMSAAEFVAANLELVNDLLDTPAKQAPGDRGALIAEKVGSSINPTYLEPKDLKLAIKAFDHPQIKAATEKLTAHLAERLLAHSPELIDTGADAMRAFEAQIRQAVILAAKVDAGHPDDPIAALTAKAEIFGILPTQPLSGSTVLITRAKRLSTADESTHHLWEGGLKMNAGPGKSVLIPSPERLIAAKAFLGANSRSNDERLDGDILRLRQAIKVWRGHEAAKTALPGRIKKLERQIRELRSISKDKSPSPEADLDKLHPLQLETMILTQSGRISVQSRVIHQHQAALANQNKLAAMAETDPPHLASRFLIYRQNQVSQRLDAYERAAGEKDQSPSFRLSNFPRRSMDKNEPEPLSDELTRLRNYLAELDKDKAKSLPDEFTADMTALWNYLRLGKAKHDLGLITKKELERISTGMQILASSQTRSIGVKFWRGWFIDQAVKRVASLETQLDRADRYQSDREILKEIQSALETRDPNKMQQVARQVSDGPQKISLDHWIQMQTVPAKLLGKSKAKWGNWEKKEIADLEQARRLVKLAQGTQRVRISIPDPDRIQQAIDEKRQAAQNYKSAKAATLLVLDELEIALKNRNPFVPLEVSQGATLAELIAATVIRVDAARAGPEITDLGQAKDKAREELERLRKLRESGERKESLGRLNDRLGAMKVNLATADDRLVEEMGRLDLAANPQLIHQFKSSRK